MRKVIAISVVFALIAGAAFAQTSVSGSISVRGKLIEDTFNDVDNTAVTTGEVETAYVQLSGQNGEGTFGGLIRLRGEDGSGKFHRAFAWWRPIPQLKIFFGQDPDGMYCPYNAWSFTQGEENYAHPHNWENWRAGAGFLGNWEGFGLSFSIYPVQGLEVDITVPFGSNGAGGKSVNFNDLFFGSLELAVVYGIPDIGKVFLNVQGPGEDIFNDVKNDNYGRIGLSFQLTAVEGIEVQLGFATTIPGEVTDYPLNLGLIVNYTGDGFGVKFRSRVGINGTSGTDGTGIETGAGYGKSQNYVDGGFVVGIGVQPWINLGPVTAYLNIGFVSENDGNDNTVSQLYINPYIRMGFGGGSLRFGVLFEDPDLDADKDAKISVPLIFGYSF